MNDQIKIGGCPFCGSQSCVAGQCRMEMPNIDDILNQEIVRETLLEINPLADDALVEQMWALCKGNPWDATISNDESGGYKMNERIRELAEQAGIAVWGDAVYMYHPSETLDSTVMAKFAELIVRECADIATINQHQWHSAGSYVLKHFGFDK